MAGNAMNGPIGILLPTRQGNFFRWCLSQKMRILKPFSLMSAAATFAPSLAKSSAVALPIPDPAPVTRATFPLSFTCVDPPRDRGQPLKVRRSA